MVKFVKLDPTTLSELRKVDKRLVSYNVEMTEVTGGTFWKAYTPGQIDGTEEFPPITNLANPTAMMELMQYYPPIDLYNPRLRKLAKELGTAWVRISGTWASKTYYDFDDHTGGKAPQGYQSVLTRQQWIGVLDFIKAIDAKLLVSMANCEGLHSAKEPWNPSQAELIFGLSKEYGVPIDAAEFMNEPNMMEVSGTPHGYTPTDYARDQDIFHAWVRENFPGTLIVGPCTTGGEAPIGKQDEIKGNGGMADIMYSCTTDELMQGTVEKLDVFSYHYYNGVSERMASLMPAAHWKAEEAHTEAYLATAPDCARTYAPMRDKYCPGGQMWVTESGDAGGGGDTWASTYLDVLRTLNELGSFAAITDGVIFHNTLASSDYGYLQHGTFEPRPNYFAVLLWNHLMGQTVYDAGPVSEGAHVYAHSRKDGQNGMAYLIINNSLTEPTTVELPKEAACYALSGEGGMRGRVMLLNGKPLALGKDDALPALDPVTVPAGTVEIAPGSCTFLII